MNRKTIFVVLLISMIFLIPNVISYAPEVEIVKTTGIICDNDIIEGEKGGYYGEGYIKPSLHAYYISGTLKLKGVTVLWLVNFGTEPHESLLVGDIKIYCTDGSIFTYPFTAKCETTTSPPNPWIIYTKYDINYLPTIGGRDIQKIIIDVDHYYDGSFDKSIYKTFYSFGKADDTIKSILENSKETKVDGVITEVMVKV